jgi:CheY-like chemotaxis protein
MKTILVVDDRPDARYATTRVLTAAGYDVRETGSGRDAIRLTPLPVDLVVLDVDLVDLDGFEVCRRIKADPATASIPVLLKTAVYRDAEHERRGYAAGANGYLRDPIAPEEFLETVGHLLSNPTGRM